MTMRVPRTPTELLNRRERDKRRSSTAARRRVEGRSDAPVTPAPAPVAKAVPADDLLHERRMREAGGPEDTAHYRCACGFRFDAPVSTSVACPNCGTGQAW